MALYRENPPNVFKLWTGEKIGGVWHPREIETAWPVEELEALKLFIPREAEPVPEGMQSLGTSVKRVNGTVQFVHELEEVPVPYSISPLQARKALRASGMKTAVDAYVANLPEAEREEWEYATEIRRTNATLLAGAVLLSLTDENLDDLFRLGATL
jgi:hypothetical protein